MDNLYYLESDNSLTGARAPQMTPIPGSQYYNDTSNFMVYGGCKNWRGHSKSCSNNTIVFPTRTHCENSGGFLCDPYSNKSCNTRSSLFANTFFVGNDCIVTGSEPYDLRRPCYATAANLSNVIFDTVDNTLYTANASFRQSCGTVVANSLQEWQAAGRDPGTTIHAWPTPRLVLEMGKRRLGL